MTEGINKHLKYKTRVHILCINPGKSCEQTTDGFERKMVLHVLCILIHLASEKKYDTKEFNRRPQYFLKSVLYFLFKFYHLFRETVNICRLIMKMYIYQSA